MLVDVGELFLYDLQRGKILADYVFTPLEVVLHVQLDRKQELVHFRLLLQLYLVCSEQVEDDSCRKLDLDILQIDVNMQRLLTFLR